MSTGKENGIPGIPFSENISEQSLNTNILWKTTEFTTNRLLLKQILCNIF
jgi:hypothetical protein